nr:hypothetical protein [Saprospiraceae bacterium]
MRILSLFIICISVFGCQKEKLPNFSPEEPYVHYTAQITVIAGLCDVQQTPQCRPHHWVERESGVLINLYRTDVDYENGDHFRSGFTDENGRIQFQSLETGLVILLARRGDEYKKYPPG